MGANVSASTRTDMIVILLLLVPGGLFPLLTLDVHYSWLTANGLQYGMHIFLPSFSFSFTQLDGLQIIKVVQVWVWCMVYEYECC